MSREISVKAHTKEIRESGNLHEFIVEYLEKLVLEDEEFQKALGFPRPPSRCIGEGYHPRIGFIPTDIVVTSKKGFVTIEVKSCMDEEYLQHARLQLDTSEKILWEHGRVPVLAKYVVYLEMKRDRVYDTLKKNKE